MTWSKRVITIADKISLTTVHTTSAVDADDKGRDRGKVDDRCLVFRFATGGSELYDIKAVLDFADETARINPIDPRINHPVFEIPEGNGTYSELLGVHELYFPFNTKTKNLHGKKTGRFLR